jgi:putative flippase GtrA
MNRDEMRKWAIQFIKYGLSGGVATGVHLVIFYTMAILILPALSEGDPALKLLGLSGPAVPIEPVTRAMRALTGNVVAFMLSNLTAYILNVMFVFRGGRHHWAVEIGLFYLVSAVSLFVGLGLQTWLIIHIGLSTTVAFLANVGTSLMINYAMRKFVIFKG